MTGAPPLLVTPRLHLRAAVDGDAGALVAYDERNETRFAPWEPAPLGDAAQALRWIAWRREVEARGSGHTFLAFTRDAPETLVARIALYEISGSPTFTATIGYSVDGDYEGRGYAREAVQAAIAYAFGELHVKRLVANYDPRNERSSGLLRRLGFVIEGYVRDALYLRDRWRDGVVTALVNPDWTPPAPKPAP